jgi:hypothetical protein
MCQRRITATACEAILLNTSPRRSLIATKKSPAGSDGAVMKRSLPWLAWANSAAKAIRSGYREALLVCATWVVVPDDATAAVWVVVVPA